MPNLFSRQFRNEGTYISASTSSSLLPHGTLTVTASLDTADLLDPALTVRMAIEANDDPNGIAPWYTLVGTRWTGGRPGRDGNGIPPQLVYSSSVVSAALVRGVLDINKRVRLSLDYAIT